MRNIILILLTLIVFTGCRYGEPTYETFEYNNNWNIGKTHIPNLNPNIREIYSEDKYIYIFRNSPKGCVYGYLTNRDDKSEKVIGWIIISGKEFCKEQKNFTFQI